jgi:hypothetical protein
VAGEASVFFILFFLTKKVCKKVKSAEIPPHSRVRIACRRCRPHSNVAIIYVILIKSVLRVPFSVFRFRCSMSCVRLRVQWRKTAGSEIISVHFCSVENGCEDKKNSSR